MTSDQHLGQEKAYQTIGQVIGTHSPMPALWVADNELEEQFLASYSHMAKLDQCVNTAVEELGQEPYLGRVSNARVMGRTMELMRELYGLNVPRGWYPAMKRLRTQPARTTEELARGVLTR